MSSPGNKVTSRGTSASYDRTLDQTYNAVLNYNYQINKDHYLDAMVGFEYYDSYNKGFNASGSGAPTDDFMDYNILQKKKENAPLTLALPPGYHVFLRACELLIINQIIAVISS